MLIRRMLRTLPVVLLFAVPALSAPIDITFASSLLNIGRGQTGTFTATLTNTTASVVFLNGDALGITAPLIANDTKFLINFPLSLAAGQMFTAPVFDITVPVNAPFGIYSGTFDVQGGSSSGALTVVGSANFAVNVPVPEPGTLGLMLCALAIVLPAAFSRYRLFR